MNSFLRLTFYATVSKGCSGEYRIWIPKHILEKIPDDAWLVDVVYLRFENFKQTLKSHPLSKAGVGKRYIPIYTSEIQTDYREFGKMSVEIVIEG